MVFFLIRQINIDYSFFIPRIIFNLFYITRFYVRLILYSSVWLAEAIWRFYIDLKPRKFIPRCYFFVIFFCSWLKLLLLFKYIVIPQKMIEIRYFPSAAISFLFCTYNLILNMIDKVIQKIRKKIYRSWIER